MVGRSGGLHKGVRMKATIQVGDLVKVYEYAFYGDLVGLPAGACALVVEKWDNQRYVNDLVVLYRGERRSVSSTNCDKVSE